MKITDIIPQKRNERVNIFIDEKFAFGLSQDLRYKYELYVDKELTQEFIDDVLKSEEENKTLNAAFNILSYSQNTKKQIYNKLIGKGYEEEYILKAIKYCESRGYLDDELYAKSFIKDKTNLNKYGSNKIRYDLINKGISKDIIDNVLVLSEDDEYERALELANKKMKSYQKDDKNTIYRKLGGFLARRGYPFDIVSKVLKVILNELE